ncbi:MAG: 30S ribosomal protein S6 [bacterium]|nr:30S ribosomal protein S6 [bacterium]
MAKEDTDMRADEASEDAGSDPRVYELGFHLDPELPVEEVKMAYQTVREFVENKSTIIAEGEPQKIQLAYTISRQRDSDSAGRRDFDSAYFSWIVYETLASDHSEILTMASSDKHIFRFIDLLTTKDSARHSVEIRELSMKTPERESDPEDDAKAELDAALENVVV